MCNGKCTAKEVSGIPHVELCGIRDTTLKLRAVQSKQTAGTMTC